MNTNRVVSINQYLILSKIEFKKPLGKKFLSTVPDIYNSVLNSQRSSGLSLLNKLDFCAVKCPSPSKGIRYLTNYRLSNANTFALILYNP